MYLSFPLSVLMLEEASLRFCVNQFSLWKSCLDTSSQLLQSFEILAYSIVPDFSDVCRSTQKSQAFLDQAILDFLISGSTKKMI